MASDDAQTAEIRAVADSWEKAWNDHDMRALGSLFVDDADFVNVAGLHWKGRTQIELEHANRHEGRFKESVWQTRDIEVQLLNQDFAILHLEWSRTGDRYFGGEPNRTFRGIFTWLLKREGNRWLIRAAHNTYIPDP